MGLYTHQEGGGEGDKEDTQEDVLHFMSLFPLLLLEQEQFSLQLFHLSS